LLSGSGDCPPQKLGAFPAKRCGSTAVVVAVFTSEQGGIYPKNLANRSEVKIPRRFDSLYLIVVSGVSHRFNPLYRAVKVRVKKRFAKKLAGKPDIADL